MREEAKMAERGEMETRGLTDPVLPVSRPGCFSLFYGLTDLEHLTPMFATNFISVDDLNSP
jgi:hypothetical protein